MADRDIPEEMVEGLLTRLAALEKIEYQEARDAGRQPTEEQRAAFDAGVSAATEVITEWLAGRQVVDLPDEPSFEIMTGHLVVAVDGCTCEGGGEFPHRPECGYEPVVPMADLLAALERDGRTVVALPAPDETLTDDTAIRPQVRWNAKNTIIPDGYVVSAIGCSFGPKVNVRGGPYMDPDIAEQYAAMLLAAAREARRLAAGSGSGED